ncbi:MAG: hypothetical protein Q9M39_01680 [Sulfurovum sp.]|nr:hypothetical protein [Sulfurovum sp.]
MKFSKHIGVSVLIAATLTFTGCTQDQENLVAATAVVGAAVVVASNSDGSHTGDYYHHDHNYGENRNYSYRRGVRDGCDSAKGRWSKDHDRFRHDNNYKEGWKAGHRRCR